MRQYLCPPARAAFKLRPGLPSTSMVEESNRAQSGFTLIELMITLVVLGILVSAGAPQFTQFTADQRVRATASDLYYDLLHARAEAIARSHRVAFVRTGSAWTDGWTSCVDMDSDGKCGSGDVTLRQQGAIKGRLRICTATTDFADAVIFRPSGEAVRSGATGTTDGFTISDNMNDSSTSNDSIRAVLIGGGGRISVLEQNKGSNGGTACPAAS